MRAPVVVAANPVTNDATCMLQDLESVTVNLDFPMQNFLRSEKILPLAPTD